MKIIGLLISLLLASLNLFSQEKLSLDDAIREGLKNNFGIIISKNRLQIASNNATIGNAGFLPTVDITADYLKGIGDANIKTVTGGELNKTAGTSTSLNAGINLNWTIFDGMKMFAEYALLKKIEEIGEFQVKTSVESVVSEIIKSYFSIALQKEILEFLHQQEEISQFRLNIAQINYDAGSGSELELIKAQVDINFDKSDIALQEAALEKEKANLNKLLSRNIDIKYEISDSLTFDSTYVLKILESSLEANNTALLAERKNMDLALIQKDKVMANYYPDIDLRAGYNYSDAETETGFTSNNMPRGLNMGISAKFNLFNGLNDSRLYRNAQLDILNSQYKMLDTESELKSLLYKSFSDYSAALKLIELEGNNLALAKRNIEIAKESYSVGSISSLQLRDIQKDLLRAEIRLEDSKYSARITGTDLLLLSGLILK